MFTAITVMYSLGYGLHSAVTIGQLSLLPLWAGKMGISFALSNNINGNGECGINLINFEL